MPTAPSWIHLNITQTHWRNDWYVQKKKVFSFAFLLEQGSLVSAEFIFARVRGCIYYYPANREMQFYFNHVETQRLCFSLRIFGITFPPHLARSCLLQGCKLAPVHERSPFELGS